MVASLTLSITTRGIGINLCSLYADVVGLLCTTDDEEPKVEMPNIYALYRALLAIVESKFYNITWRTDSAYPYSPILKDYYYNIMTLPIIFKRYLEAINILEYKGITYKPNMSKNIFNDGKVIPRPENILLSNLRQTVEALKASDIHDEDDRALQHRENFYRNNPLPGAIWDRNTYKLINADEIISPEYDLHNDVVNDMHQLLSLSMKLRNYSEYVSKYCVNRNVDRKSFSSFISNEMCEGNLRVPDRGSEQKLNDYYWNSRPEGNIDTFYSRFKLRNNNVIKEGTLFLLGEYPNNECFANRINELGEYPNNECFAKQIYELRSEHVNSYFYRAHSYSLNYLSHHNDIVARSLQNA